MPTPPFRIARPASPLLDLHRQAAQAGPLAGSAGHDTTPARAADTARHAPPHAAADPDPRAPVDPQADAGTPRANAPEAAGRARFGSMDSHLHCSVIGTCLSTGELRKAMARFIVVEGASDLDVHHEAVRLAQRSDVAHALNKLLDRKHEAIVQRFGRVRDPGQLASLWQDAVRSGEVPGAYWAVLTHRRVTDDLRQQVFGDVHMLSHLVGAANRADIRRLVAIEQENTELQQRNLRQQQRIEELVQERDGGLAECERQRLRAEDLELALSRAAAADGASHDAPQPDVADRVAVQAQRREAAEAKVRSLESEVSRLCLELERVREHLATLDRELAIAEAELRRGSGPDAGARSPFAALEGRRLCNRQSTAWLPLRSASVTSLATAIASMSAQSMESMPSPHPGSADGSSMRPG